jgi:hypothetical protein
MRLELGPGYLPAFVAGEVLPKLPVSPGAGIHDALFRLARVLTPWRSEEQIYNVLCDYAQLCGRHVPESEIASSIRRARLYAWNGQTHSDAAAFAPRPQAPEPEAQFDLGIFRRFVEQMGDVDAEWLAARSPICPWNRTPTSAMHALYQEGEKVLVSMNT